MIGTFISKIAVDLLAIYFAYKLLSCDLAEKKWVMYAFIVLHVLSLLLSIGTLVIYLFFKDLYNKSKNSNFYRADDKSPSKSSLAFVGIMLTLFLILSIVLFFIDIYFLFKLYQCSTPSLLIYIVALLASAVLQVLKL